MKKLLLLLLLTLFLASCGSSKRTTPTNKKQRTTIRKADKISNSKLRNIVKHAKTFEGTRYKFGGTSKKGMDCSGLIYVSFLEEDIALPRVSRDMAKKGKRISLTKAEAGDLLFFQTNKSRNVINHVGLVVESSSGELKFIHSTTSRGVIISSINERYWNNAFVEIRRII